MDTLGAKRGRFCPDEKFELTACANVWSVRMARIKRVHPAESRGECLLTIQGTVWRAPVRSTT